MSIQTAGTITIVAPAASGGFGGTAVLNNPADTTNFVGYLEKVSGFGGAQVRTVSDDIPEGDGAVFGRHYYASRPFTLEAKLSIATSYATSDARFNRLVRAWNAMASDGTIDWVDSDGYTKRLSFRQEQPPGDPGEDRIVLLGGRAADPRIYRTTITSHATAATNNGNAFSPPIYTFTPSATGTVTITNSTSGLGSPALSVTVGTGGVSTGSAVTVNTAQRTVTQGGTRKDYAVVFSSTWWEVAPGANTWAWSGSAVGSNTVGFYDAWLNG